MQSEWGNWLDVDVFFLMKNHFFCLENWTICQTNMAIGGGSRFESVCFVLYRKETGCLISYATRRENSHLSPTNDSWPVILLQYVRQKRSYLARFDPDHWECTYSNIGLFLLEFRTKLYNVIGRIRISRIRKCGGSWLRWPARLRK